LLIGCGHVLENMFYAVGSGGGGDGGGVVIVAVSFTSISSTPCLRHVLFNLRYRDLWSGRKMEYRIHFPLMGVHERGVTSVPSRPD
jgi:hypothetical protein